MRSSARAMRGDGYRGHLDVGNKRGGAVGVPRSSLPSLTLCVNATRRLGRCVGPELERGRKTGETRLVDGPQEYRWYDDRAPWRGRVSMSLRVSDVICTQNVVQRIASLSAPWDLVGRVERSSSSSWHLLVGAPILDDASRKCTSVIPMTAISCTPRKTPGKSCHGPGGAHRGHRSALWSGRRRVRCTHPAASTLDSAECSSRRPEAAAGRPRRR